MHRDVLAMGESELGGSVGTATREVGSTQGKKATKPGRFTFASYVDSIKVGLRKIAGSPRRRAREPVHVTVVQKESALVTEEARRSGGVVVGIKRKKERGNYASNEGSYSKKTSFEMFLSTLPKFDSVDRTLLWLYQQPLERVEHEYRSLSSLPQRGSIVPLPQPPLTRMSSAGYETSLSCCESDRGTHGRGSPPLMDMSQPRLDDLFRQLHIKQERQARKELARQGEGHLSSRNLRDIEAVQMLGYPPGVTPELLPFLSHVNSAYYKREPSILHKNSFYYQPVGVVSKQDILPLPHRCEWGNCNAKFSSSKELFEHVRDEHIQALPSYLSKYKVRSLRDHRQLMCRWRRCWELFDARYKLILHLQNCHFKGQRTVTRADDRDLNPLDCYSPPPEVKHSTHPHRTPFYDVHTPHYPTQHSSLHVTSYPPQRAHQQSKRRKVRDNKSLFCPQQPEDMYTPHSKYRPIGR